MLPNLISLLLMYIKIQEKIIVYLLGALLGKSIARSAYDEPVNKPYRKLQVDEMPKIVVPERLQYQELLEKYYQEHGKSLKPVNRHKNSKARVPNTMTCPKCGAPHEYLYYNTDGRGQYKCKVCSCCFNAKNYFSKPAIIKCPHCLKTLEKIKERKDYWIYKCKNDECSFYKGKLSSMSTAEKERFLTKPHAFKIRYIYRQFHFDYKPLDRPTPVLPKVDLSKLYVSPHTLGLILTFHVNYGMSARKTAALMEDVYGLKISHQSILNYADAVAKMVKPFVDYYPYELSNSLCGDETYIRVGGK